MTTDEQIFEIRKWWNERIIDGCQFEFFEDTREKMDWSGEERWKKYVRIVALKTDFERSRNTEVKLFGSLFIRAAQHDDTVLRKMPIDIGYGLTMQKLVCFYRFVKQPLTPLPV